MSAVSPLFIHLTSNVSVVSESKGVSANMLKESSKRRRTKKEVEEAKQSEANREADIQTKLAQIEAAEHKLNRYDELYEQLQKHQQVLTQMQDAGLIDIDDQGNVSPSKKKP